ncbi:hypothetical protein LTR62_007544 [Meristemomyces frigidus]|uniref:Uncharacterized protein n=1 Tax=Meristemomyces frigidus TaxID=1508187 RepID=A0AAN7TBI9_9PEZI|nr:hypothetical protein LTR62_007544 [Meristemomyces frigidus]
MFALKQVVALVALSATMVVALPVVTPAGDSEVIAVVPAVPDYVTQASSSPVNEGYILSERKFCGFWPWFITSMSFPLPDGKDDFICA